ncbi:MAG: hypothetical protein JW751_12180 [Polyangiaceae bacterium]|nr:hypothetical protein [Polyangiaceae bacterium]
MTLALALFANVAAADPLDAALVRAVAAKERALEASDPARWEETLLRFQEADALGPSRETRYEIGFAAQQLHQLDLALEAYESAIAMGLSGSAGEKARAFIADHVAALGRIDVSGPAGTTLSLSGLARGELPLGRRLVVFAGETLIEAKLPNGSLRSYRVQVQSGEVARLAIEESSGGSPAPTAAGVPSVLPMVPEDRERTELPSSGIDPATAPDRPLEHRPLHGPVVAVAGAVVATGSVVLVPIANGQLASARNRLDQLCSVTVQHDECAAAEPADRDEAQKNVDAIATWRNLRIAAFVGVGVGMAGLVVGTLLATLGRKESVSVHSLPIRVAVGFQPGGGYLSVDARF